MEGNFLWTVLILATSSMVNCARLTNDMEWTAKIMLENGYEAKWSTVDKEYITMEIKGPSMGWIAVGFTDNGAMKGADIILGWVDDNGTPHLKDLHGVGNEVPVQDSSQDVELLGGEMQDGSTVLRFRRKWNTCDKDDYVIGEQTIKMIWAVGKDDPTEMNFNPSYHGPRFGQDRGVKMVNLRLPPRHSKFPEDEPIQDPNIKFFDIVMDKHPLPGGEVTQYRCQMNKYPLTDRKSQIIGWRPLIQKENVPVVHHILMMECIVPGGNASKIFEKDVGRVEDCYTPSMPSEWMNYCWTQPFVWTIGGDGDMYPPNVGMPMGEKHGGSTYFYMEMHYDTPDKLPFTDSSGIRFYYTEKPRPKDISTMFVGKRFSSFHLIAPSAAGFNAFGGCTPECTRKSIPPEGIWVTHILLHAHQVTKKIYLRHIRNGIELPLIGSDTNYDINYQQAHIVDPPRRILPGDELLTTCEYDTSDRDVPLWGGITTNDTEMCHTFVTYYPKIKLATCQYQTEYNDFLNAVGVGKLEGDILPVVSTPFKPKRRDKLDPPDEVFVLLANKRSTNLFSQLRIGDPGVNYRRNFWDYLTSIDWRSNNAKNANDLNRKLEKARNYAYCTGEAHVRIPLRKYIVDPPNYQPWVDPADSYCSRQG